MSVGSFESASAPLSAVESVRRSSTSLAKHARVFQQALQPFVVSRIDAVEEPLELPLHDRERRAQLVRDVGHQLPPRLVLRRRAHFAIALNARAVSPTHAGPNPGSRTRTS